MKKSSCPVCGSQDKSPLVDILDIPVYCNVLHDSRKEASLAPRGRLDLVFCNGCSHVYNQAFDSRLVDYSVEYENALEYSKVFSRYINDLASYLVGKYDLYGKDIVEIACGRGHFLRLLCEMGKNRCVGFDPSYSPLYDTKACNCPDFRIVGDYYSEKYSYCKGDLVCCRQALEHMEYPGEMVELVRSSVLDENSVVFFEVPNVLFTLRDMSIWDLIYEHCGYFTLDSLEYLFRSRGYEVTSSSRTFGDQYVCIEARPVPEGRPDVPGSVIDRELNGWAASFPVRYADRIEKWKKDLSGIRDSGKRVVLWGGGSKGVTFLNVLGIRDQIRYVVDINPHKHGKFIALSGQQIVPPEFLKEYRPEIVVVMNPVYLDEIREYVDRMDVPCSIRTV